MATASATLEGSCACGGTRWQAKAAPVCQLYCHCKSCRNYSCAPFIASVIFKREDFEVTKGNENLFKVNNTPDCSRFSCGKCRSAVYSTGGDKWPMAGTTPYLLKDFDFKPQFHIQCNSAVIPESVFNDGLPRFPEWPPFQ